MNGKLSHCGLGEIGEFSIISNSSSTVLISDFLNSWVSILLEKIYLMKVGYRLEPK